MIMTSRSTEMEFVPVVEAEKELPREAAEGEGARPESILHRRMSP